MSLEPRQFATNHLYRRPTFHDVLEEHFAQQAAEAKKARTQAVEARFSKISMAVLTLGLVVFFSVAVYRIAFPDQYANEKSKGMSSRLDPFYEFAGSMIYNIFHFHWFGIFGRYHVETEQETVETGLEESQDKWYIGVLLALIGTMVAAVGNHVVTLAHKLHLIEMKKARAIDQVILKDFEHAFDPSKPFARRKIWKKVTRPSFIMWIVGNVAITVLGTLLTLLSLAFASQSLLAPLSGLTIVWNALLATTKWFGEKRLSSTEIFATILTLAGCIFIVVAGPRNTAHYGVDDLVKLFFGFAFQSYSVLAIVFIAVMLRMDDVVSPKQRRLAHGLLPGVMGGFSNVLAKAAVELISKMALFNSIPSILIFFFTFTSAICQLRWINQALEQHEPLFIVPVYQASLLVASTACGMVYFEEYRFLSLSQVIAFATGIVSIVLGVSLLAAASDQDLEEISNGKRGWDKQQATEAIPNSNHFPTPPRRRLNTIDVV